MTKDSWIQEDVSRHFRTCSQCGATDAENVRVSQPKPLRQTLPDETLAKMCSYGRAIYRSYLRWLGEPEW